MTIRRYGNRGGWWTSTDETPEAGLSPFSTPPARWCGTIGGHECRAGKACGPMTVDDWSAIAGWIAAASILGGWIAWAWHRRKRVAGWFTGAWSRTVVSVLRSEVTAGSAWQGVKETPEVSMEAGIIGGAGAVGSLATQLLKARTPALVIGTGSRPESGAWSSQMGADLVLDHASDLAAQLADAGIPHADMVLSTAGTARNLPQITAVLRPFGHLAVVDGAPSLDLSPLMGTSPSLHTEMAFPRVIRGYSPQSHGRLLNIVAELVANGRMRPITTTRLDGLSPETMKTAHEMVETGRTIGKIVIEF